MTHPIPAINSVPYGSDRDPGTIFYAVGHSLNCWENMEFHFSRLYSIFIEDKYSDSGMSAYGKGLKTLTRRLERLQVAANSYFVKYPNQDDEGCLHNIIKQTKDFAIMRHRIAHGQIQSVLTTSPDDEMKSGDYLVPIQVFFLSVPPHSAEELGGKFLSGMGSGDILNISFRFQRLAIDAARLAEKLLPSP